ncbi:hypothetical protein [Phenylobacterium sp.]|uniref:hypothetical protein n=1 Tax=Phenylobacterium sp. TaxID=1871053 RepID=UPI0040356BA7
MSAFRPQLLTGGLVAFAILSLGMALAALLALDPIGAPIKSPLVLTLGQSRTIDAALAEAPPDLRVAAEANGRIVALAPYDSSARLRIAYIDSLDGQLGDEGLSALALSYQLLPFDQYVSTWRISFALNHWGNLTPDVRRAVEAETFAFAQTGRRRELLTALAAVDSPIGAVPAAFWAKRIQRDHARRVSAHRLESGMPQDQAP